ncbi:WhiB family transcriptional regulator [Microbacterium sp. Bi128]|uniref:WhiB family transcriptional regulator n=1 Tax=Microbacterium sp. Bi128 TaxID=2821115 RepID=UPI0035ABF3D9
MCAGDSRFTDDRADPTPLKAICARCPVVTQCRTLAIANPGGTAHGVWGVLGSLLCRPVGRYGLDDD